MSVSVQDPTDLTASVFAASAQGGYRYLVVMLPADDSAAAPYVRAIETADEVVPLLRRVDKTSAQAPFVIVNIHDLGRSWDEQKEDSMALQMSYLPERTRHDLRVYYEGRDAQQAQRQAEMQWARQPLIKRLFTAKPVGR